MIFILKTSFHKIMLIYYMKISQKKKLPSKTGRIKIKNNKSVSSRIVKMKKVKIFNKNGVLVGHTLKAKIRKNSIGTLLRSKSKHCTKKSNRYKMASKCVMKHIKKYFGVMKRFI